MEHRIVEAVPLREQVADIIRNKIVTGALPPGSSVRERQLSRDLGVSTTPVKEAFRILESEGLLYSVARKGSFISEFSKKNMLQIVFMRSSLEGVAAFFAARNATQEDLDAMEQALKVSGQIIEKEGFDPELAVSNEQFHMHLRRAANNDYLVGLIRSMKSVDDAVRRAAATSSKQEPPRAQREHLAILQAIRNRDSELAEQLMISHVRRVGEFILDQD